MARRSLFQANPNMWNAGAVILKPPAHQQYLAQLMQHQMAKDAALSQYYNKLQNSINPAGVRDQDMEGWMHKLSAWEEFGLKYHDALINPKIDGGKAQRQFSMMHTDLMADTQKSKQAALREKAVATKMLDPKWRAMATNDDMHLSNNMSKSIYDKDFYKEDGVTPYGPEDFSFNAPPFDLKRQIELNRFSLSGLKKDRFYGKGSPVDPQTRLTTVPYTERHSAQNLKTIAERVGQAYDGDKSMQSMYQNKTLGQDEYDNYNKAYKSIFPNDDIGTDPRKIAQGEAIARNMQVDSGNITRSVSRVPIGRGATKAQQEQELMFGLTKGLASAMKSRDVNEVKRLAAVWGSGNGKNTTYQDIDYGPLVSKQNMTGTLMAGQAPKKGFILSHVDKTWVPDPTDPTKGTYQDILKKDEFDPDDPNLINQLGKSHQNFMGSTPALEKAIIKNALNQGGDAPAAPAKTGNKDSLGLFK